MKDSKLTYAVGAAIALSASADAFSLTFSNDEISAEFTSTLTTGLGMRTKDPSASLINQGNIGGPPGRRAPGTIGDQGDLNYGKHDLFTQYIKGNHELLVNFPEDFTFMTRVNWLYDFAATQTTGYTSSQSLSAPFPNEIKDGLTEDARDELRFKARLLDFWVSKRFNIGDQVARVRVGNQVINWGESIFAMNGINQTNAIDLMRFSQPGTQLKEVLLPAPMISVASGVGSGVNVEAYVQHGWEENYLPPTGSYWSTTNGGGAGHDSYGFSNHDARDSGQWGLSVRWDPESIPVSLGAYVMRYHDKMISISFNASRTGLFSDIGFVYPEDRMLYGISANAAIGNWAVGSELSYRPKDAVGLNASTGCASNNGDCWIDEKRWQWIVNGTLSLTPSNARTFLDFTGATTGSLIAEGAAIYFPDLKSSYKGLPTAPGLWAWGNETDPTADPQSEGTKLSAGVSLDFSLTYDGNLIPGWQVTPEIYYSRAIKGRTPTITSNYMEGASNANFIVTFSQNPLEWQFGINYAKYWGGHSPYDQPYADRDFVGAYVSYNF